MIVWVVRKEKRCCVFEHLSEALSDWKTHKGDFRLLYPKFMSTKKFKQLTDFIGW